MKICDFCKSSQEESYLIITNENIDICDKCIMTCMELLVQYNKEFINRSKETDYIID